MKERPILFNTEMVRAILQGRKTQTRRVVKDKQTLACIETDITKGIETLCPYGQVGDVLWVRKTWTKEVSPFSKQNVFWYKADVTENYRPHGMNWKPSIHMPKEACRLKLRIKNIRVERLQDISNEDVISEGIDGIVGNWRNYKTGGFCLYRTDSFRSLWEFVNGDDAWKQNPWVWVIEFERIWYAGRLFSISSKVEPHIEAHPLPQSEEQVRVVRS